MRYGSHSVLLVQLAVAAAGAAPLHVQGQDPGEEVPLVTPDAVGDGLAADGAVALPVPGASIPAVRFPGARTEAASLRPLYPAADLDRRLAEVERLSPRWVYVGLGAALGGAIGFALGRSLLPGWIDRLREPDAHLRPDRDAHGGRRRAGRGHGGGPLAPPPE